MHSVISKPTLWNTSRSGEENDDNDPFLVQSTLPYLAPHFDQIANHHYRPAFDEGMQQKRAEIAAIALNPQTPDFNNTILALEQSGELLTRVTSIFCDDCGAYQ
ncbi:hypothetical protein ACLBR5_20675 [Escherichia coli]